MLKNTAGKPDAVLTLTAISVTIVLLKLLLNGLSISVTGATVISFGQLDSATVGTLLTPLLSAYVARRYTEIRYNGDPNAPMADPGKPDADQSKPQDGPR